VTYPYISYAWDALIVVLVIHVVVEPSDVLKLVIPHDLVGAFTKASSVVAAFRASL
jgi:hypothetical protein